ncbi:MAG: multidrug effflux MFS transporter [Sandaracinaceae bacterium]|nr:multidrug effflux MFS transporter [Sandaracinaceae bacterium]
MAHPASAVVEGTEEVPAPRVSLSAPELIAMVATLMALNALAVDLMLPAMSAIASDLGVRSANDQQLVIVVYVLGFGFPQLGFGPLADRFGRRRVLAWSIAGYTIAGFAGMAAPSFGALLVTRFIQGVFAAGCRVVAVTLIRDLFAGRQMARVMSLVMTVFMIVPIIAPGIGQLVLLVLPWQWCFGVLGVAGALTLAWTSLRLPETLAEDARRPLGIGATASAYKAVLTSRPTFGYMLASGVIFAALFSFLSASEQIFREVFHQGETFALWFAAVAVVLGAANFANSRLVVRFGMRRLAHGALVGFTISAILLWVATRAFGEHLAIFFPLFTICFALFGLIGANFNALAMEPLGKIAGTGSAAYGFATTTVSAVIGGLIGRAYDGTTGPLLLGYVVLGLASLGIALFVERGRLFGDDGHAAPARAER